MVTEIIKLLEFKGCVRICKNNLRLSSSGVELLGNTECVHKLKNKSRGDRRATIS